MKIEKLDAIQILDSRGNPTLKVFAQVNGVVESFCVPSGASTGKHEALELRDCGKEYNGLGVKKAINNIEKIEGLLFGKDPRNQKEIDLLMIELDSTPNKSLLGANAILGVSCAVARATAKALRMPLYQYLNNLYKNNGVYKDNYKNAKYVMPRLFMNILNGGKHAENNVDIQETMIVPNGKNIEDSVRIGSEVYHSLKNVVKGKSLSTGLGDEGGFAPDLESNTKALDLIIEAINNIGLKPGKDISLALDVAASEIYEEEKDQKYILNSEKIGLSSTQMTSLYKELISSYPIISIEDGLAEDDWEGWQSMTERIGKDCQLVGDDLFVTNHTRIKKGIEEKSANAVLIKLNQIGTLTETFDAIRLAVENNYNCMISHRSGETEDSFIADLVVATEVGQIKSGAPARGERTAKYNRLIEIEKEINSK